MKTRARALALVLALVALVLVPELARSAICTYGLDCPCDCLTSAGTPGTYKNASCQTAGTPRTAGILFCEDFENPLLADGNALVYSDAPSMTYPDARYGDGWSQVYGPESDSCMSSALPNGQGIKPRGAEGDHAWSCFNVVQSGACEGVASGSSCVLADGSSLMYRYLKDKTGDIIGSKSWTRTRDFGITMLIKWSSNWIGPHESSDTANKTDEWGSANNCILGCSVGNANQTQSPFAGTIKVLGSDPGGTAVVGQKAFESGGLRYGPNPPNWGYVAGQTYCIQYQAENWGLSNGRIRYWIDGDLLVDLQNVDLSSHTADAAGIGSVSWNNFTNGPANNGYQGATLAGRFEDNLVVTNSAPVPCSQIGFGSAPETPGPSLCCGCTHGDPGCP